MSIASTIKRAFGRNPKAEAVSVAIRMTPDPVAVEVAEALKRRQPTPRDYGEWLFSPHGRAFRKARARQIRNAY